MGSNTSVMDIRNTDRPLIAHLAKRLLDVAVAGMALLLLWPLMLVIFVALRASLRGPAYFTQERPGLNGRLFKIYKFRTMSDECDEEGRLLPDGERLTPLGTFLRRTSLDELPQLLNILQGDLSLVGPRPLLPKYLPLYTIEQNRRHDVPPGLTGWAQVNGRNAIAWEERFALDVWYVDNWSLWLDFKILGMTALRVLQREGINSEGQATVAEFTGTKPNETPSCQ